MPSTALLLAALCGILTALIVWQVLVRPARFRSRWSRRAEHVTHAAPAEDLVVDERSLRGRLLGIGIDWGARTEQNFHLLSIILAAASGVVTYALGVPLILVLLVAGAGFLVPRWWLGQQEGKVRRQLDEELKTAVGIIITTLRVQPDTAEAIRIVRDLFQRTNLQSPLTRILSRILQDESRLAGQVGGPGGEKAIVLALRQVREYSPSTAVNFVAFALAVYATAGGDFADVLAAKQEAIQDYLNARDEAETAATEFKGVFKLMPLMLAGGVIYMSATQPSYAAFYLQTLGQIILVVAIIWMVMGYIIANNLINEVGS
ncbi:MAG: hypothetical protein KKA73_10695 [Chloroflexi bacterium]|nr:hypothetical protein [Chloroflexota bacterium]MBU1748145.1 hypothetical protein [Chloroflexota bacterium]